MSPPRPRAPAGPRAPSRISDIGDFRVVDFSFSYSLVLRPYSLVLSLQGGGSRLIFLSFMRGRGQQNMSMHCRIAYANVSEGKGK